jgi:nucleoside-diphosphate-sugar epimerase
LNTLKTKLETRKATAAVIGLGYVGLPLAMEIAAAGFKVIGIDLDATKIAALKQGKSYILDVPENSSPTRFAPASLRRRPTLARSHAPIPSASVYRPLSARAAIRTSRLFFPRPKRFGSICMRIN